MTRSDVLLLRGDSRHPAVRPKSVNLVFFSPPYFGLRDYRDGGDSLDQQLGNEPTVDEFINQLLILTAAAADTLTDDGNLFVNIGDRYVGGGMGGNPSMPHAGPEQLQRSLGWGQITPGSVGYPTKTLLGVPWRYALACVDQLGLILRTEIIWVRKNAQPETAKDRCRRNHEYIFHFSKKPKHYHAASEAGDNDGRPPLAVWEIANDPLRVPEELGVKHHAPFPPDLVRKIITGWCPPSICLACNTGRYPLWGTPCEECGGFRPQQSKSCPDCGHIRDWQEGREVSEDLAATDWSTAGHGTPRLPGGYESRSIPAGWACACWQERSGAPEPGTRPAVVFDPCCGTGTTPMVASVLGRIGIGADLSSDYLRIASWRINDPAQRSRVIAKDNNSRQIAMQF